MAQNNNENFLNGIFIQLKEGTSRDGQHYSFQKMAIKVEELIRDLKRFKPDERGFVNFTVSPQKKDKSKYSVALDTFVHTGPTTGPTTGNRSSSGSAPKQPVSTAADDLPF